MKPTGAMGRENAGMSNRNCDENSQRRKSEVSSAMAIIGGLGDPKDNPPEFCYDHRKSFCFKLKVLIIKTKTMFGGGKIRAGKPMASRLIFRPRF